VDAREAVVEAEVHAEEVVDRADLEVADTKQELPLLNGFIHLFLLHKAYKKEQDWNDNVLKV
jgi:hypothetical protein